MSSTNDWIEEHLQRSELDGWPLAFSVVVADADFVCAEGFTGIITKHHHRWLAIVPGYCACCAPREILGPFETRTQAAIALAERAEFNIDGFIEH